MKSLFEDRALDDLRRGTLRVGVLTAALCIAPYSDRAPPKVFRQRQPFALLVLREYTKTTYRGVIEQLILMPKLRDAIFVVTHALWV
jgi:hypothetical protein